MDLIDLIGDTRTDSLPPGFLRSIKIKYKHEASHVFPPGTAFKTTQRAADTTNRADSAASLQSTPSFMNWNVPNRLVHSHNVQAGQQPGIQEHGTELVALDEERAKLSSRLSAMSIRSAGSLQAGNKTGQLPRLGSVASNHRKTPQEKLKPVSPSKLSDVKEAKESLPVLDSYLGGVSLQGKKVITKILTEADRGPVSSIALKAISPKSMDAVDKWLTTATDKEREIALKFFSTLAGMKTEYLDGPLNKYHTHIEGNCNYCDGDRIEETLNSLARGDRIVSRGRKQYNPKREPDLAKHSYYQQARQRRPVRFRQQFQTWHHLPIYSYPHGVTNKTSMFTQPHKPLGRHFSIHPEWGLHTGIKPTAF